MFCCCNGSFIVPQLILIFSRTLVICEGAAQLFQRVLTKTDKLCFYHDQQWHLARIILDLFLCFSFLQLLQIPVYSRQLVTLKENWFIKSMKCLIGIFRNLPTYEQKKWWCSLPKEKWKVLRRIRERRIIRNLIWEILGWVIPPKSFSINLMFYLSKHNIFNKMSFL